MSSWSSACQLIFECVKLVNGVSITQNALSELYLTLSLRTFSRCTYTITSINQTAHHNNNLDPFTYTTTSQYTSNEFYKIIINTRVSKRLIIGYRQYLIYRKIYIG